MGRGLLSRLGEPPIRGVRPTDETAAVVDHLRALLNTRKGDSATVPEFGVPEFTDLVHSFPAAIQLLQRHIRGTITDYEPRLKNVAVRHLPDENPLILRYEITAQMIGDTSRRSLRFSTQVSAGGRITIW